MPGTKIKCIICQTSAVMKYTGQHSFMELKTESQKERLMASYALLWKNLGCRKRDLGRGQSPCADERRAFQTSAGGIVGFTVCISCYKLKDEPDASRGDVYLGKAACTLAVPGGEHNRDIRSAGRDGAILVICSWGKHVPPMSLTLPQLLKLEGGEYFSLLSGEFHFINHGG